MYLTIPMGHVVDFRQKYLRQHWDVRSGTDMEALIHGDSLVSLIRR